MDPVLAVVFVLLLLDLLSVSGVVGSFGAVAEEVEPQLLVGNAIGVEGVAGVPGINALGEFFSSTLAGVLKLSTRLTVVRVFSSVCARSDEGK